MTLTIRNHRAVVLAVAVFGLASATALAQSPMLSIQVGMNGSTIWGTEQPGTNTDGDNIWNFTGQYNANPNLNISWDMDGDPDPFLAGAFAVTNMSGVKQDFSVSFVLPTIPLAAPTLTGGSSSFSVTVDGDGGSVQSVPGTPIYQSLIDGVPHVGLFTDPFDTGFIAPSTTSPTFGPEVFGAPVFPPTFPGPAVVGSIGIHFEFSLTPGDSVGITGGFNVVPEPATAGMVILGGLALLRRRR